MTLFVKQYPQIKPKLFLAYTDNNHMVRIFLLIFAFQSFGTERFIASSEYQGLKRSIDVCDDELTFIPPFVASHKYAQKDKVYENIRKEASGRSKVIAHLPLRSLVEIAPSAIQEIAPILSLVHREGMNQSLKKQLKKIMLPINVLYSNNTLLTQLSTKESRGAKKINMSKFIPSKENLSQSGTEGFINALSLDIFDESKYVYRVKKNAPVFTVKGRIINNMVIQFRKSFDEKDGAYKFKANKCCLEKDNEKLCHFKNYAFEARNYKNDSDVLKFDKSDIKTCCGDNFYSFLKPVPIDDHKVYMQTLNILADESDFVDDDSNSLASLIIAQDIAHKRKSNLSNSAHEDTLMKIPLFKDESYHDHNHKSERKVKLAPFSSYHYNPLGSRVDESNDEWGKPLAVCAFLQTLKHWDNEICYGRDHCKVGFGHIYHPAHLKVHNSHERGECFDVRPFNSNLKEKYHTNHYKNVGYDRETTKKFLDLIVKAGAKNIYFNDPKIYKKNRNVRYFRGHNNHLHFCFPAKAERTISTCMEGISETSDSSKTRVGLN